MNMTREEHEKLYDDVKSLDEDAARELLWELVFWSTKIEQPIMLGYTRQYIELPEALA